MNEEIKGAFPPGQVYLTEKQLTATASNSLLIDGLACCPFCGGRELEGPHMTEYIGDTRAPYWWLQCKSCPCYMEVDGETDEALVAAWQKRAG